MRDEIYESDYKIGGKWEKTKSKSVIINGILWFQQMWKFIHETYGENHHKTEITTKPSATVRNGWVQLNLVGDASAAKIPSKLGREPVSQHRNGPQNWEVFPDWQYQAEALLNGSHKKIKVDIKLTFPSYRELETPECLSWYFLMIYFYFSKSNSVPVKIPSLMERFPFSTHF